MAQTESPKVKYSLTRKINLGNYESIDIDIGLEDRAAVNETTEEAFRRVTKTVETVMFQKSQEVLTHISENKLIK